MNFQQSTQAAGTKAQAPSYRPLALIIAAILTIYIGRTALATTVPTPRLFDLFNTLTVLAALALLSRTYRSLQRRDWLLALCLGLVVGGGMLFATQFSPYPVFGLVRGPGGQALVRGLLTFIATLGGLAVMRLGGPVPFYSALRDWRRAAAGILMGLGIGLPLALLNAVALQLTEGRPIVWQSPTAALLDALQPAIVEEVVYRFALWGLLWLALRRSLPAAGLSPIRSAIWISGLLAMLVHNFAHFDDLLLQAPAMALSMGVAMALLWGLPPLLLARRRGLESAIAFHWLQDVVRFITGF